MKKKLKSIIVILSLSIFLSGCRSTLLVPSMDYNDIQSITDPRTGRAVYDREFACLRTYTGSQWDCPCCKNDQLFGPQGCFYGTLEGGIMDDIGYDVTTDIHGNVYVTGYFKGTATFGSTTLTSAGMEDIFILKYLSNGEFQWAKRIGGLSIDIGRGIAADSEGSIYITGHFQNSVDFGDGSPIESDGEFDVFVAKYDASGAFNWVQQGGGVGDDIGWDIEISASDEIFITGQFKGDGTFGDTTITSLGDSDIFTAMYFSNGDLGWINTAGGVGTDEGRSIAIDLENYIYISGAFQETASFGSEELESAGDFDIFVSQYDSDGSINWACRSGGSADDRSFCVTTDNSGNVYASGYFKEIADFATDTLLSAGLADIFITKYDRAGNRQWTKQAGGEGADVALDILADAENMIFISGLFSASATFGPTSLTSWGGWDILLGKYNENGNLQWIQQAGGTMRDQGTALDLSPNNKLYITGAFRDRAIFRNQILTSTGAADLFLWKYAE